MECPICLEPILGSSKHLHCSHIFHKNCIDTWLSQKDTCPLCRTLINFIEVTIKKIPFNLSINENHLTFHSFNIKFSIQFSIIKNIKYNGKKKTVTIHKFNNDRLENLIVNSPKAFTIFNHIKMNMIRLSSY